MVENPQPPSHTEAEPYPYDDYYIDSSCSTPYVSAPSSPGRLPTSSTDAGCGGFYYSAPASPMHFVLSSSSRSSAFFLNSIPSSPSHNNDTNNSSSAAASVSSSSFEFDFDFSGNGTGGADSGSEKIGFADELFLNGQIRPMKLASHLQRPQVLAPLIPLTEIDDFEGDGSEKEGEDGEELMRSREMMRSLRDRSMRRRTRSLSPLRSTASFDWGELVAAAGAGAGAENEIGSMKKKKGSEKVVEENAGADVVGLENETAGQTASASSSRCSSAGRSSKRWVFLKDFLRSKSEGRNNVKFWTNINISFSPGKEKKIPTTTSASVPSDLKEKLSLVGSVSSSEGQKGKKGGGKKATTGKKAAAPPMNGVGKRRMPPPPSVHEVHYAAYRAQAEEMRKKTYLPYRQGLLGCLGFSSKSYGAINGFARALNPVSSR